MLKYIDTLKRNCKRYKIGVNKCVTASITPFIPELLIYMNVQELTCYVIVDVYLCYV